MCGKKNCRKVGRTFVENKCKNKVIDIGNSNPQGWAMEYGGKSKGDGEDNAKTWEWRNFFKGSDWMSSIDSLPRPQNAYGKKVNKFLKEV